MKLRYVSIGVAMLAVGLVVAWQAPLISRLLLTKTDVLEIPRKDFRLLVERVWRGDVVRLDVDVQKGEGTLYIFVERVHFYIGPRQEFGVPARIFTSTVHGPSRIDEFESVRLDIDLEGHLNILLNNTSSLYPKTVSFTRVFEKSTNVEYGTIIFRNMCILAGSVSLFIGFLQNYEEYKMRLSENGR